MKKQRDCLSPDEQGQDRDGGREGEREPVGSATAYSYTYHIFIRGAHEAADDFAGSAFWPPMDRYIRALDRPTIYFPHTPRAFIFTRALALETRVHVAHAHACVSHT